MTTGEKIINKAEKYKGKTGGFVWNYWSGLPWGSSWCVGFVLYVLYKCGLKSEIYNPKNVSNPFWLPTIEEWLHKHAKHVKMANAKPGDIVIFTWDGGGNNTRPIGKKSRDHIGFIRKKGTSDECYTIEGNTSGGKVDEKTRGKTYIFAIYRLKCCQNASQTDEKTESKETINTERKAPKNGDKCLDLSAWQGELSVDWFKTKKAAGYKSVILRSSYTKGQQTFTLRKDSVFDHNITNAHKAGMNIGVYHFSQMLSESEAKKEAEFCVKCIKPYKEYINLPVACDYEWYGRLTASKAKSYGKAKVTKQIDAFLNVIEKAGFDTMVYASLSVFTGYISADVYKRWKIWVAQYYPKCEYKHKYYLWQYTSNNGKLDENVFGAQAGGSDEKPDDFFPARGYFKEGDTGAEEAQKQLNKASKGHKDGDIKVDGEYGPKTAARCKFVQNVKHITEDGEYGPKTHKKAKQKVTIGMKAVNWWVSVARDNSFAYGTGSRAHRGGCYFCGTNTGPRMKKKEQKGEPHYVKDSKGNKHTYEKTYCCNPFVLAGLAHGANLTECLKKCRAGSPGGLAPADWPKAEVETVGRCKSVPFDKLQIGDFIISVKTKDGGQDHAWAYTGGDYLVEASVSNWSAKSISHKKGAKARYKSYQGHPKSYVMRPKG